MMRDKRKDEAYFKKYKDFESTCIQKWEQLLQNQNAQVNREKIAFYLFGSQMKLLIASFSIGDKKDKITKCYSELCSTCSMLNKISYQSQLRILSLGIILDNHEEAILKCKSLFELDDKLIKCLWTYYEAGTRIWEGELLPKYAGLDSVFQKKTTQAMLDYLSAWYENNNDTSWYESEKCPEEIYNGYWSFESAAIAKMLSLNETELIKNQYYPVL